MARRAAVYIYGMRRTGWVVGAIVAVLAIGAAVVYWGVHSLAPAHSDYVPRDPTLRRADLFFYVPRGSQPPARAMLFFFGNDIGFWEAHQELAADLQAHGYAVVGYDVKPLIQSLPRGDAAAVAARRDAIVGARVDTLIRASRRELGLTGAPVVLIGHSFGAELAVWTAYHVPIPLLRGVVAIAPAARGHLAITAHDLADIGSPREPGSFGVAQLVATLPSGLRVALVRGAHDRLRGADSAIVSAGGTRLRYWIVPLASHSLKRVVVARYVVRSAVEWVANLPAA